MMHKNGTGWTQLKLLLVIGLIILLSITSITATAEEYEDSGEGAEGLGSFAAWGGVILIGGFVVFREAYLRFLRDSGIIKPITYKNVLTLHAITSILLGLAGLYHGYTLQSHAGPIEYALITVIIFTLISGTLLWLSKGKMRRYIRLIHVQRILAVTILILVILHTSFIGD
ncbi:MAG: hypothetical protein F7B78_02110 [Desulfurococcales archaeon]|nr:hypothetical protein [Desulfurococcales archaeon]